MANIKLSDYLKITEAAEYLGVSANTLRNWEKAGKISVKRHPINGYRLFSRRDLDLLLDTIDSKKSHSVPKIKTN